MFRAFHFPAALAAASAFACLLPAADGSLSGVVRDPSGAAVPRARITVIQAGGNLREFAYSKDAGEFSLSPLPEGTYSIAVAKEGFALNRQEGIVVSSANPTTLAIVLNVGRVHESMEVVAQGSRPARPAAVATGPAAGSRIRVGGNVQATKLVAQQKPLYPADCKAEGVEGTVLFRAVIGRDGGLLNLEPLNHLVDPRLVAAAGEAVRNWRYQPTLLNGEPIEVVTEIEINFRLSK